MAIRIWGEEDDDSVCLRLVKRGQVVALVACDNTGEEKLQLATICEKGIYRWTGLPRAFGIATECGGRIQVLSEFPE